jgi:hypothetical protein
MSFEMFSLIVRNVLTVSKSSRFSSVLIFICFIIRSKDMTFLSATQILFTNRKTNDINIILMANYFHSFLCRPLRLLFLPEKNFFL